MVHLPMSRSGSAKLGRVGAGARSGAGITEPEVEAGVGVKIRDWDRGQGQGQEAADAGAGLSGQQWQGATEPGAEGGRRNQQVLHTQSC